jgi:hypothetical protein
MSVDASAVRITRCLRSLCLALGAQHIAVTYRSSVGAVVSSSLDRVVVEDVVDGLPVREFRWYKGRQHYSGIGPRRRSGRVTFSVSARESEPSSRSSFDGCCSDHWFYDVSCSHIPSYRATMSSGHSPPAGASARSAACRWIWTAAVASGSASHFSTRARNSGSRSLR